MFNKHNKCMLCGKKDLESVHTCSCGDKVCDECWNDFSNVCGKCYLSNKDKIVKLVYEIVQDCQSGGVKSHDKLNKFKSMMDEL